MGFTTNVTVNWDQYYTGTLDYWATYPYVTGIWTKGFTYNKFHTKRTGSVYHAAYTSQPWVDYNTYSGSISDSLTHNYRQDITDNRYLVTGNWKLTHSVRHSGTGPVVGPSVVPDEPYSIGIYGSYGYRDIRFAVANF